MFWFPGMAIAPEHFRSILRGSVIALVLPLANRSFADPPDSVPTTQSAPLLRQLSDETEHLYRQSRHSLVRVQLPTPQWLEQYNQRQLLLQKWGSQLDPEVKEQILEQQDRSLDALQHRASTRPATQSSTTRPATLPTTWPTTAPFKVQLQLNDVPHPDVSISLFAIGLLVDGDGHAVFPISVDRKYLGDAPLPAVTGDGQATTATFVGCDPKTNLTVLQLKNHTGTPAALGHSRPEDGSLTLVIATDGSARLLVWNGQHPEAGFAVLPDGAVAGFGFNQHFLAAATAKPIVDQLIATGEVHRAILGVLMKAVDRDDALRHQRPALGTSPAIRITAVQEGSAAAQGGLQIDDLILSIDDQPVGDAPTFAAVIATHRGQTTLKVLRGEKAMDVVVNLQPK